MAQHAHLIKHVLRNTAGITCFINKDTDTKNVKLKELQLLSQADYSL